jgi:hypothetical protein
MVFNRLGLSHAGQPRLVLDVCSAVAFTASAFSPLAKRPWKTIAAPVEFYLFQIASPSVRGMSKLGKTSTTHERFAPEKAATPGSDRAFGTVMGLASAVLALLNFWHAGRSWTWLSGIGFLFFAAAILWPATLHPLNMIWFKLGLLLHRVINPLVMALLFYGMVWPTGLVMRALGRDALRLKREPQDESYWIVRRPPGPKPETMKDQF